MEYVGLGTKGHKPEWPIYQHSQWPTWEIVLTAPTVSIGGLGSQRENSSTRENRSFTELYKLDLLYGYFRFPLAKGLAGRKKSHHSSRKYVMRTSELADHTVYVWYSNIYQQLVHKLSNTSSIPPNSIIWGQRGGSTIKIISFSKHLLNPSEVLRAFTFSLTQPHTL